MLAAEWGGVSSMDPLVCGTSLQSSLSNGKVAEGGLRDGEDS